MMKPLMDSINAQPKYLAWLGTITGWISFDLLRSAQFAAALLAGLVSLCALILTGPKAWAEFKTWFKKSK
jgi:hypothetical protein